MRKEDIQVGKTYADDKGGKRKIIRMRYHSLYEDEVIFKYISGRLPSFLIYSGPDAGLFVVGLRSFARWAKSEVKETPDA